MPLSASRGYSSGRVSRPWASQNVAAGEADAAAPLQRADAEAAYHAAVLPLAEVGVHVDAGAAGQTDGLREGVLGAVDGLAGGQHDLPHGEGCGVVVEGQQALAVVQIGRRGLAHLIGDSAALPAGQRVGAPGRHEAEAHHIGGLHLAVHRGDAGGGGVAVLVIHGAGAAVLDEVGHAGGAGVEDHVAVDADKDLVDVVQPLHQGQARAVDGHQVAHESLKEVVVGVDQPGVDVLARSVDDLRAAGAEVTAYGLDAAAGEEDVAVVEDAVRVVAGDDGVGVPDQYFLTHGAPLAAGCSAPSCCGGRPAPPPHSSRHRRSGRCGRRTRYR